MAWMAWAISSFPVPVSPFNQHSGGGAGGLKDFLPDCLHDRAAADDVLQRIAGAALPGQLAAVKLHLVGQRVHLPHQVPGVDESVGDDINKDPVDLMLRVKAGEVRGEGGYAVMGHGLNGDRFAGVQALHRLDSGITASTCCPSASSRQIPVYCSHFGLT